MTRYVRHGGLMVPASFAEIGSPEQAELAAISGGRDVTRGLVHFDLPLQPQDTVLLARGAGNYRIYRELLRDDQVRAAFSQRQLAVVSREWEVTPGGKTPRDEEIADAFRAELVRISFDRVTERMLYGVFYGYAVAEVLWEPSDNMVRIGRVAVRDRRRFVFDGAMRLRLLTLQNPSPGEILPERKFWSFATGSDHDDEPYGLGLAHWLYWPVFFKRGGMKLWLTFLDKFGAPTAKGEYPSTADDGQKRALLEALEAIHSESGVIIPEGMAIELLEAARSGTASYTELYDRMDAAIAKVTVGQSATVQGTPGRLGNDDAQQAVRADLVKADADLVCESFNRTVAKWWTEYNYGPDVAPPEVWRKMQDQAEVTRAENQALVDMRLARLGFRPTPARIEQVYGTGYEQFEIDPQAGGFDFAEAPATASRKRRADQAEIGQAGDLLSSAWERLLGRRVQKLLAYAEDSRDFETFRERLAEIAADEPDPELREALLRSGFSARLWGAWRADRPEQ